MNFQPIMKWTGSKRSQSETIINKIPKKEYDTYHEPFCGGCSILYQLLNSDIEINHYICSDINNDLIEAWNFIKNNPILVFKRYTEMWNELNKDDNLQRKKDYFNFVRKRFNEYKDPCDFIFIMRTTTNGMPRYNKQGKFNNSFHITRNGMQPQTFNKILQEWSYLLNKNNVEFINQSYNEIITNENDLLYLDPPYANTKQIYYGAINNDDLWNWLRKQKCDYLLSFDGKTTSIDNTYDVPKDIYDIHEYLYNGNSSFRRVIGNSKIEYVEESLYIKNNKKI